MNRWLVVIAIVLFFVAGYEVLYLMKTSAPQQQNSVEVAKPVKSRSASNTICFPLVDYESILNESILEAYKRMPPDNLNKAELKVYTEGRITKIEGAGQSQLPADRFPENKVLSYPHEAVITYQRSETGKPNNYIVPSSKKSVTTVRSIDNKGESETIDLSDLSVGDNIEIVTTMRLDDKKCPGKDCTTKIEIVRNPGQ